MQHMTEQRVRQAVIELVHELVITKQQNLYLRNLAQSRDQAIQHLQQTLNQMRANASSGDAATTAGPSDVDRSTTGAVGTTAAAFSSASSSATTTGSSTPGDAAVATTQTSGGGETSAPATTAAVSIDTTAATVSDTTSSASAAVTTSPAASGTTPSASPDAPANGDGTLPPTLE